MAILRSTSRRNSDTPVVQLRNRLKLDANWQKFRNIVSEAYKPEFDDYITELSDLHKSRSTRLLSSSGFPTGKKVAAAASKEIAVRSRAVEICIEIARNRNWLNISMSTMKNRIEVEHSTFLGSIGVRGVTERKSIAQSVMARAQKVLDQLDTITEIADLVISDIDQAGYALKHIVDSLQVATRREGG